MNLVKVTYKKSVNMCHEVRVKTGLTPEQALKELKAAKYPAYIYEPALIDTDAYFLMEIKNRQCINEYKKIQD